MLPASWLIETKIVIGIKKRSAQLSFLWLTTIMGVLLIKQKVKRCTANLAAVGYMYCGGHGWDEVMLKGDTMLWYRSEGCTMLCWLQVHRGGHRRDGVHWGRVEHERPGVRVPAVPGRHRRGRGGIRRGGELITWSISTNQSSRNWAHDGTTPIRARGTDHMMSLYYQS